MEGYNKKVIMSYWTICRMKTTKKIYVKVSIIFLLGGILLFSSCEKEENQKIEANRKTLFMYLPWSSNLTNYFYNNISDLEKCITKIGLNNEKVIVFISTGSAAGAASLFAFPCTENRFSRNALVTTQKLDKLIAAAPNIGFNFHPNIGYHTPAASGIPITL